MQTIIENTIVSYEVLGINNKKNLLIIHGWQRNLRDWIYIAKSLSQKYKVYLIDLPGHGGSTFPKESVLDTYGFATFVEKFIDKQKIKNLTLVGHSFGGKISCIIASKSKNIKSLFLVDASGLNTKTLFTNLKNLTSTLLAPLKNTPFKNFAINLTASDDYKNAGELLPSLKKIVTQNLDKEIKEIKIPTIIIWGEKDKVVPISAAKKFQSLITNSHIRIVWGAGHHPHVEKSDKFLSLLGEYL